MFHPLSTSYPDSGEIVPEATNPRDTSPNDEMEMGSVQSLGENIYENENTQ